jgi:hypothetical protein
MKQKDGNNWSNLMNVVALSIKKLSKVHQV